MRAGQNKWHFLFFANPTSNVPILQKRPTVIPGLGIIILHSSKYNALRTNIVRRYYMHTCAVKKKTTPLVTSSTKTHPSSI